MSPSDAGEHICRSLLPVVTQMEFRFPRSLAPVCACKCFMSLRLTKTRRLTSEIHAAAWLTGRFGSMIRVFLPVIPDEQYSQLSKNTQEEEIRRTGERKGDCVWQHWQERRCDPDTRGHSASPGGFVAPAGVRMPSDLSSCSFRLHFLCCCAAAFFVFFFTVLLVL